ncbi:carbohydrate ABC transporter permease [Candidatus Synechococcus calcipolaris G9]|uniref:Carbohydrate ABC transporter permease n=1 Tax=Candidatus Synechococcus calcipolaris G9 TaxID=1497997 RepID=A0ABT6EX08_9SYNE|nr:carbohydrate ABC transporter permease [Candidatus Synechococcus calcipolaris]MDG2990331.1 carbohydrate ABC transporter permease [Candidatus Synechococcus calcipolaris G9]
MDIGSMLRYFLGRSPLWVFAGFVFLPLLIAVLTSGWPVGQLPTQLWSLAGWSWQSYAVAWSDGNFIRAFANSAFVAVAVTLLQIVTSAMAGYGLARLVFPGRRVILLLILATLVIPFQLLVIPIFLVLKTGHLINTYGALILPTAANGFGIFLMRQFFLSIPVSLEEAALLDGASRWQILWQILLPLSRPALVTLFIFTFIGEWNDLFKPLIFTTKPELITVQLSLANFQEQFTNDWPLMMAAAVIATIPVVVIFLLGQRQFVRGIAATGVKS